MPPYPPAGMCQTLVQGAWGHYPPNEQFCMFYPPSRTINLLIYIASQNKAFAPLKYLYWQVLPPGHDFQLRALCHTGKYAWQFSMRAPTCKQVLVLCACIQLLLKHSIVHAHMQEDLYPTVTPLGNSDHTNAYSHLPSLHESVM